MTEVPGMDGSLAPLGWPTFVTQWDVRPVWTLLAALALVAYVGGLVRVHRSAGPPAPRVVHPWRVAAFVAGLVLLVVAVSSGIETYAYTVFWIHMVQHLTLIMVVPCLLVLGSPLTLLVAATREPTAARIRAALLSRPVAFLTHPITGFAIYAVVIVVTHLTSFMDAMMTTTWLTSLEQVLYVVGGYLFLLPVIGAEPIRWHPPQLMRIFLLLIGMLPDTVVGIVLLQTGSNLFPTMLGHTSWAPDPVRDLNTGGAIMWVAGDGLMMVFAVGLVVALISRGDRGDIVGTYLEGVRRESLRHRTGESTVPDGIGADVDVDSDDAALAAYNRMLGRMNQRG